MYCLTMENNNIQLHRLHSLRHAWPATGLKITCWTQCPSCSEENRWIWETDSIKYFQLMLWVISVANNDLQQYLINRGHLVWDPGHNIWYMRGLCIMPNIHIPLFHVTGQIIAEYCEQDFLLPEEWMHRFEMCVKNQCRWTAVRILLERRKLLKWEDALTTFLVW